MKTQKGACLIVAWCWLLEISGDVRRYLDQRYIIWGLTLHYNHVNFKYFFLFYISKFCKNIWISVLVPFCVQDVVVLIKSDCGISWTSDKSAAGFINSNVYFISFQMHGTHMHRAHCIMHGYLRYCLGELA